jgi:DNA-binding winged helix-turn-helix (wHTH) protein
VTATDHPLGEIRRERRASEFCELFEGHTHNLAPLIEEDGRSMASQWADQSKTKFSSADLGFVIERAGGHPGLIQAVCRVLARSKEEALLRPGTAAHAHVQERLDSDSSVRLECAKLWSDLALDEQETLISLLGHESSTACVDSLLEKGIMLPDSPGPRVFAQQFADFVNRQRLVRRTEPAGVRIDVDAGDVHVDGELVPSLTDLEYKLLLLLYGNLGRICDKYGIVESVWGENYIDEVDDARIEKLVSRLRDKIEPVPEQPRYLVTVRGRGYKLISPE